MAARKGPMRTRGMEGSSKEYQAPAGQTQDEQAEHQMPSGGTTAGVGGMSLVAMSAPMGGMPGGGMGEPAVGTTEMPSGGMEKSAGAGSGMPTGGMRDPGSGPERFRPDNLPPGAEPPAAFEPGVVEVEFRDDARPQLFSGSRGTF